MTADIDLAEIARAKNFADPVGHYSRPDIFRLIVNRAPQPCVEEVTSFETGEAGAGTGAPTGGVEAGPAVDSSTCDP